MKTVILDLFGCATLADIHEKIKTAFDFPNWYGANFSAFRDLLITECDADEVVIRGEKTLSKELRKEIKMLYEILEDKKEFNKKNDFKDFTYKKEI